MVDLKGIDLTLESTFVGQDEPYLLFEKPMQYHLANDSSDGRDRIFYKEDKNFLLNAYYKEESFFPEKDDDFEQTNSVNLCHDIFGSYPKWFDKMMPFTEEDYECNCHLCGKRLNLLNSPGYGLCHPCNDSLEERKTIF